MGWTYIQNRVSDIKEFFSREFNSDNFQGTKATVLDCFVDESNHQDLVAYMAYEILKPGKPKKVTAIVCLVDTRPDEHGNPSFGYKDMDETMGPYYYTCPKSILDKLTPTKNKNALEWRKKCLNFNKQR